LVKDTRRLASGPGFELFAQPSPSDRTIFATAWTHHPTGSIAPPQDRGEPPPRESALTHVTYAWWQTAVIEYARNVMGMAEATSTEFNAATPQPVVVFMPEGSKTHMGGTMRLGLRRTVLQVCACPTHLGDTGALCLRIQGARNRVVVQVDSGSRTP
jgi:hypothetical protein